MAKVSTGPCDEYRVFCRHLGPVLETYRSLLRTYVGMEEQ